MGKVIAVLSGKGGVGKTTIAANLAVVLAKMGKKVLAVDANLTSSGLTTHFGLSPSYGLTNLLDGNKKEEDVVMMSDIDNLYVIGTTFRIESFSADLRRMKAVMDKLRKDYDFIIVDAAPTLG
ncbi:MAG TPA: MinD/ParA family protein, partial [Candidatus Aenigmarchaeota archaeon]|nr:MinD/ParA family protein [Candidatus Aenigmarchaeota archaeon]